jgi:hypothetical protein
LCSGAGAHLYATARAAIRTHFRELSFTWLLQVLFNSSFDIALFVAFAAVMQRIAFG